MDILSNAWVTGIGGGILSGLIVMIVSRLVFLHQDRRDYAQKILAANREILHAVRPGISEGKIPADEVLRALALSTARKFGVDHHDLFGPEQVAHELITEVMASSFISAERKEQYCQDLTSIYRQKHKLEVPSIGYRFERENSSEAYRWRMIRMMSLALGFMTAATSLILALRMPDNDSPSLLEGQAAVILLPVLLALLATMAASILIWIRPDRSRQPPLKKTPVAPLGESQWEGQSRLQDGTVKEPG